MKKGRPCEGPSFGSAAEMELQLSIKANKAITT
jgi:hypothetical protein